MKDNQLYYAEAYYTKSFNILDMRTCPRCHKIYKSFGWLNKHLIKIHNIDYFSVKIDHTTEAQRPWWDKAVSLVIGILFCIGIWMFIQWI